MHFCYNYLERNITKVRKSYRDVFLYAHSVSTQHPNDSKQIKINKNSLV